MLQWGRRCSSTETLNVQADGACAIELQWGRRCSSTETCCPRTRRPGRRRASMGPSMFVDGDQGVPSSPTFVHWRASMGPSMFVDGDVAAAAGRRGDVRASMGPSMFVDGDVLVPELHLPLLAGASMGPSMFVDGDSVRGAVGVPGPQCFNGAVDVRRRRPAAMMEIVKAVVALQWGRRCSSTETCGPARCSRW